MTRIERPGVPRAGDLLTTKVRIDRAAPARLALRWEVAAAAVPEATLARSPARYITLEWTVPLEPAGRGGEARAELVDPSTGARAVLAVVTASRDDLAGPVRCTSDGDLRHIEIDGLLTATLRVPPPGAESPGPAVQVLYARTSLLGQLEIPGGRYELIGAAVVT
ncbi:MAG: hypothetical protein IT436_00670 [Phycisphaerales bacterium]|nr:hypothetical protein [Phycisphaerales bacterium]